MSKHTPGPWRVITEERPHYLGGTHVERRIFTVWEHPQLKDSIGVVNYSIGIPAIKGEPAVRFVSIEEADARLIAAAPAMLEALEGFANIGEYRKLREAMANCLRPHERAGFLASFDKARAAIATAKGEA